MGRNNISAKKLHTTGRRAPADKKYRRTAQSLKEEKVQLEEMHEVTIGKLKAKILQLETLVSAQKARIDHLERETKDLRFHGKMEVERSRSFFEARLKRVRSEYQEEKSKRGPIVQLHPAEVELAKQGSIGMSKNTETVGNKALTKAKTKILERDFAAGSSARRKQYKKALGTQSDLLKKAPVVTPTPEFFKYLDEFSKVTKDITEKFRRDNPIGEKGIVSPLKSLSYQRYNMD